MLFFLSSVLALHFNRACVSIFTVYKCLDNTTHKRQTRNLYSWAFPFRLVFVLSQLRQIFCFYVRICCWRQEIYIYAKRSLGFTLCDGQYKHSHAQNTNFIDCFKAKKKKKRTNRFWMIRIFFWTKTTPNWMKPRQLFNSNVKYNYF